MSETPTLESAYKALKGELSSSAIDNAALEARMLVERVTGYNRAAQIGNGHNVLREDQLDKLKALLARRLSGEPMDNILGVREFYGLEFKVTPDVLSPRPETEALVDYILDQTNADQKCRILDLGTGSGAIIISILNSRPEFQGVAVDVSAPALSVARENAQSHKIDDRLLFRQGDWFSSVTGLFDFIVSNPPYITSAAMDKLSTEVRDYDPDVALQGGCDGLNAYRVIAEQAADFMEPDGKMCLEIGYDQGNSVPELLRRNGLKILHVKKDLFGHDRVVVAARR